MRQWRARRSQRGFIAVEYALALGLILVPVGLLVITLPAWPERQTVARVAAEEGARTAVLTGDLAAGEAVAMEAVSNQGIDPNDIDIAWTGSTERGGQLTAAVTIRMPAIRVPAVATVGTWDWTARHSESVDLYRSRP